VIQLDSAAKARPVVDRSSDRIVAMSAVAMAIAFLCVALVAVVLPLDAFSDDWLPLHLALAGAASTAIAGVMPFFSAAFAAAPPIDARLRWTSVGAVASGASAVTIGATAGLTTVAVAGGITFATGAGLVAIATIRPRRHGLGAKGGLVTRGYVAALAMVTVGAILATLFIAGWAPVVQAWGQLRPAHAWLNLVGFVSLVIATTLLHFFPTVVGSRIERTPSAYLTVAALGFGAALVALGYALMSDWLARIGAASVVVAAAALLAYVARAWRTRAHWNTDPHWHLFSMGGLASGIGWFIVGTVVAAGRILIEGADPASASIDILIGPLVLGWVGLTLLASATHLVPAIGPGGPHAHARQRSILGTAASGRLIVADVGILAITVGQLADVSVLSLIGLAAVGTTLGVTAALIAVAVALGLRPRDSRTP
jgi:nitrite reductase (NO-forming)